MSTNLNTTNPAPLGLLGFGMTTILLNLHNIGLFELNSMILAMGIFYGGLAQIIAGLLEFKKGNTFGTVAFTSYGCFWLSLIAIFVFPKIGWMGSPDATALGSYLLIWGLMTFGLYFGSLKGSRVGQAVFGSLTILFGLLGLATLMNSNTLHQIAGWEGLLCGGLAFYDAIGQVLNEKYQRTILPLG